MIFQGSMTALVTPFRDGKVDEPALRLLVNWQIASGTDVLVPCGTTGESATLTPEEQARVIRLTVEESGGRVPVLAGAGSNSTSLAIKLAGIAKNSGADGMLQVTPYYNKPTQEGLYQHFKAIAASVELPMVLYNVPGRTGVNMLPETVIRLSAIDTVAGIKEAGGSIEQVKKIVEGVPKKFAVISGEDAMNLEIYRIGGRGCVSVASNVAPDKVAAVWDLFISGNIDKAQKLQEELQELNWAMFIETNPIPIKTALAMMGRIREEFRLPLTPMAEENRLKLVAVLKKYRLL